mgnify:CR=1 FL=1
MPQMRRGRVARGDDILDLLGTDQLRGHGDVGSAVVELLIGFGGLAVEQGHRHLDRRIGLDLHRLVDRCGLPSEKDVLQARDVRVLAGDRDTLEVVLLEDGDDTGGVGVVGRPDAVHFTAERGQRLLEVGGRLLAVPAPGRLGGVAGAIQRRRRAQATTSTARTSSPRS